MPANLKGPAFTPTPLRRTAEPLELSTEMRRSTVLPSIRARGAPCTSIANASPPEPVIVLPRMTRSVGPDTALVPPSSARMPPRPVLVIVLRRTWLREEKREIRTPAPHSAEVPMLVIRLSATTESVTSYAR